MSGGSLIVNQGGFQRMNRGHGGRRQGAGRKPGSVTKRRSQAAIEKAAERTMPLDYMLAVMHDESADKDRRDRMAAAAAPYLHARLQSIDSTVRTEIELSTLTAEQRRQRARQAILDAFAERPLKLIEGEVVEAEPVATQDGAEEPETT
jgi:hypothetical protein